MKCKKCGRRIRPDAKICIFCERPVAYKRDKIIREKKLISIEG